MGSRSPSRACQHQGDAQLDAHVAAAIAKPTGRGWRLDKLGRGTQIDAVICLAMAVERASYVSEGVKLLAWIG